MRATVTSVIPKLRHLPAALPPNLIYHATTLLKKPGF